ncbi:uncharacterized protein ASPGLDRAFT_62519 [Aspergillus glaucus CBS 516.65]|uniref:Aminoglycoside phosphotransferase domain-containing protein n=1 Tax=Aspergillus glaucus CBS 516.65 TaxID=1160497 RepID=A0A1L9V3Q6_ASPGL|nr:hypothetical protein ASPGLDRAFT_62519 [Aspergillus glaucus CBS 516.65]OJJ78462.1 hypothetical protein ASPGLDRAFT_62519 [Aspergillus glaucus CBS 516.65]
MTLHDESSQEPEQLPRENWAFLPSLPLFSGPTVPKVGRQFFTHSPSTILKLGTDDGEGKMTALAHSILGPCVPRGSQWDDSRVRALQASAPDAERAVALERVQRDTTGAGDWARPVLSHGDLSDRNILVDPCTLTVTGFLDWEMANIMPAYFEYVAAWLSGGHQPEWRRELLDVLRSVLRCKCDAGRQEDLDAVNVDDGEERYRRTLAAWDAVVNVERITQGYDNDCEWTFETGLPDVSQKTGSAL